ncbi:MAG: diacylglycerol kinase family lipid kinase [Deltaproteobacteria bacterium]|nr:diacylglycerol kinase family lipid kinase [Deltaproteobacteria bacterium]
MKVRIIINPVSGGRNRVEEIAGAVKRLSCAVDGIFEIKVTKTKGGASEISRDAVRRGYEVVFACGGDGTLNEAAGPLVGTATALGIVPIGSGNGLAMALNIPNGVEAAIGLLKDYKIREIDAGVICGRYFFSTAGCGFDAHLSRAYNGGFVSSKMRGLLPYYPAALWEYLWYKAKSSTVKIGNYNEQFFPFLLTAANTGYFGGNALIAPDAVPDDGLVDICIVPQPGFFKAVKLGARLMNGTIDGHEGFRTFRTDEVDIYREGPSMVHADGEPFEWGGVIPIKVLRRQLKVLTP